MKKIIYVLIAMIIIAFSIYQISMIDNCVMPNVEDVNFQNPFNEFLDKAQKEIDDFNKEITTLPSANID